MSALLVGLMAMGAVAAQLTLPFSWIPLDITFLLTAFIGLSRGGIYGTSVGLFCGLVLDCLVSPAVGLYSLSLGLVGGMADLLHENFNPEHFLSQALTLGAFSVVHDLALWQAANWIGIEQTDFGRFFVLYAFPKMAVHAFLAVPVFFILKPLVLRSGRSRFKRVPKMIRPFVKS